MKPRILLIHNFSTIHGGADRCAFNLKELLEERGHAVSFFSAESDVELLNFKVANAASYLYNRMSARRIAQWIKEFKPDIAHCHNIYGHLTPSILPVLKKHGIPIVMTLHDWKLICPNHRLFTEGKLCERCRGGHYYQSLKHRCFENSLPASFLGMVEAYLHHGLKIYENNVDLFISPSRFLYQKFLEFGWSSDRIRIIPNFVDTGVPLEPVEPEGFVYFGAVSEVKGVPFLLRALQFLSRPTRVKIVGAGPSLEECRGLAEKSSHRVEFSSFQETHDLRRTIQSSLFSVLPSLWYENQPLSILESYAVGRAVVGSDRGGISELIEDQRTGLLFSAGDALSLAAKITALLDNPQRALTMGAEGNTKLKREFNTDLHYQQLMDLYREILQ